MTQATLETNSDESTITLAVRDKQTGKSLFSRTVPKPALVGPKRPDLNKLFRARREMQSFVMKNQIELVD